MPDSFAESSTGTILVANGIDPVVRWDGLAAQAEIAGVVPPDPDVTPALAGSGTGAITGTYRCYARFVDRFGNYSDLSPVSPEVRLAGAGQVDYSNLPVPQQASVVSRQVLRNTDGQQTTFYVDVDSDDVTSTTATGTHTDASLQEQLAVPLLDADGTPLANVYAPPPATKPYLAFHIGRMFLAGEQPYSEGSVRVTKSSAVVSGVGTQWPETFAGRFLYVQGGTRSYEIDAVDVAAQTLTLIEVYEDASNDFAEYTVKPSPGEAGVMYYSQPGLPEAWPVFNGFSLPEDGDVVTGLMQFGSFLYVLKRRRMYRLTAQSNPATDGFIFYALGRGCVNHRCWVIVEEQAYLLDEAGVYRMGGGDSAEQLSTPIQDLFRRESAAGINWGSSRFFHCSYDPQGETIRWHVTLHGEYLPRHALCLHYKSGKWWQEEYPVPVAAAVIGRSGRATGNWGDDGEQVFLGGPAGAVYSLGGTLDGVTPAGPTTTGTVTSAGLDTLTDTGAAFDSSWANVPVVVTAGRGQGQRRVVVSATATTLKLNEAWAVKPDATSKYQVGGIPFRYVSGRMRYAPAEAQGGRSVEVQFQPTEGPQVLNLRLYQDFALAPRKLGRDVGPGQRGGATGAAGDTKMVIDLGSPAGHFWQRFDAGREGSSDAPRLMRVQLDGVSGPELVRVGEMVINGVVR